MKLKNFTKILDFVRICAFGILPLFINLSLVNISVGRQVDTEITGKVNNDQGEALPGASIIVKGTTLGTITDAGGIYTINAPEDATLVVSYVGYATYEIAVGGRSVIDFSLLLDETALSEVVVTALGVERETKALGYSVQTVSGAELNVAREVNVLNSLSGRVAGVQVSNGASGVGSTSIITIRGEGSLIPGQNSPLFVVDGIPISNTTTSNRQEGNLETDYGNGAQDLNPDNIESMTVLKGPSATALYGSRGANGVILITTKSGKDQGSLGVSFSQNLTFDKPLRIPKYQNRYGQGAGGMFEFGDGFGNGINDNIDESWGPPMDGQLVPQHDSPTSSGVRAGDFLLRPTDAFGAFTDTITPTPWTPAPNNIRDFMETGVTSSTNIAVSGSNDAGNFRTSYTRLNSEGIVPNTDYNRNSFSISGSYDINDWVKVSSSVNYVNSFSKNRNNNSYGTENIMYLWVWFGRQIDMNSLRDYWQPGFEDVYQFNYNYNWHDNPFFTVFENTNAFDKDRIFGNVKLDFEITDDLSLMVRSGIDFFNELRVGKRAFSSQRFPQGQYREDIIFFKEENTDFLLTYDKDISSDYRLTLSVGGNRRNGESRYKRISANSLSIPAVYNFENASQPLAKTQFNDTKRVNSLYGFANFSYKNILFLDVTGRNDWSSTLPSDNNSFFYPSVSVSTIISDMVELSSAFSFLKFRAGWAIVGNDTDPFQLRNSFVFEEPWGSVQRVSATGTLKNAILKPEKANSIEIGTDIRFFVNRLAIDFTYYKSNTKDQILSLPVTLTSGYTARVINAGEIENKGVEITITGIPIQLTNGFSWISTANFTRNRGEVKALTEGLETFQISNNYIQLLAKVGGRMGDMWGTGFESVTDENSPFFGQNIHNDAGFVIRDPTLKNLGNYNPDFMVGWQNNFTYKGINLGVLLDWRQGGEVLSRTVLIGGTSGMMDFTVAGREEGILSEGVIENADGTFRPNDVRLSGRDFNWWNWNRGNEEQGIFDATFLKLREVRVGYSFPESIISKTPFQSLTISLVGRNLAVWTENPHFDPETLSFNAGTIVPGVEDMATPTTRSMGFNIIANF